MVKLIALLSCLGFSVNSYADDGKSVVFAGAQYPLKITLSPGEKPGGVIYESALSEPMRFGYDTVLMQGEMPDPGIKLEIWVKSRSIFKDYDRYRENVFKRFPNGRFWARFAVAATKQPLKLVIRSDGTKAVHIFTVYEFEAISEASLKEPIDPAAPPVDLQDDPTFSIAQDVPFAVIRREAWAAAPPKEPYIRHAPRLFTLHHTAGRYPKNYGEAVSEIQFIQDYHQNGRGWIDIGYHFLIDPQGNILEGRPMHAVGAHVLNRNTGNIGISFMGNYHPPASDEPDQKALDSFTRVGSYIKDNYSITVSSFYAHREIGATDCPGDLLYARLPALKEMIFPQAAAAEIMDFNSYFWEPPAPAEGPPAFRQLRKIGN
ncbi:MAG: N-acetylmuramoyl-L-alanine amidase [Elusimicrobia bacterium]|nr:N-acetylmuramoyl-L-alanine amidase [Elusimicrobiota bacterium]